MRAFVYCDGEEKQLQCFQEDEQLKLLSAHLIDLGKTPASCSSITQSSDVQQFFKATKKRMKNVSIEESHDPLLEKEIKHILRGRLLLNSEKKNC